MTSSIKKNESKVSGSLSGSFFSDLGQEGSNVLPLWIKDWTGKIWCPPGIKIQRDNISIRLDPRKVILFGENDMLNQYKDSDEDIIFYKKPTKGGNLYDLVSWLFEKGRTEFNIVKKDGYLFFNDFGDSRTMYQYLYFKDYSTAMKLGLTPIKNTESFNYNRNRQFIRRKIINGMIRSQASRKTIRIDNENNFVVREKRNQIMNLKLYFHFFLY